MSEMAQVGEIALISSVHIMIKLAHRDEEYISMYPGEEIPYE